MGMGAGAVMMREGVVVVLDDGVLLPQQTPNAQTWPTLAKLQAVTTRVRVPYGPGWTSGEHYDYGFKRHDQNRNHQRRAGHTYEEGASSGWAALAWWDWVDHWVGVE